MALNQSRFALLTALACVFATPAIAQNVHVSRLYEQVLENINYAQPNQVLDSFGVVRINAGESVRITVDVPAESAVQVMGDCDEDCADLDLGVYNATGELLGEDRLDDFFPIVALGSGADGRIELELDLVDCAAAYCYAAYSVFVDRSQ